MKDIKWTSGETYETDRPADIEKSAERIKVRRNITRETRTDDSKRRSVWAYEYANMTPEQYETYRGQLAQLESPLGQAIAENNTVQMEAAAAIYEEMLLAAESLQAVMEGIAEIYEMEVNRE